MKWRNWAAARSTHFRYDCSETVRARRSAGLFGLFCRSSAHTTPLPWADAGGELSLKRISAGLFLSSFSDDFSCAARPRRTRRVGALSFCSVFGLWAIAVFGLLGASFAFFVERFCRMRSRLPAILH